jgi:DNA-binding transcriptional MerR regulator
VEKAPEAFRTISEVAEEINVPQHVLRFWESRFAQIKPMKRGGGRRYYRPDDVDLLRGVRHLLYGEGYTIRGVQRILREEGIAFVQKAWRGDSALPPPDPEDAEEVADSADAVTAEALEGAPDGAAAHEHASIFSFLSTPGEDSASPQTAATRREPTLVPPSPPVVAPGLSDDDRRKLEAVLDDLMTCRRIIDTALVADYSDDAERRVD